jgi:hypothetical protein
MASSLAAAQAAVTDLVERFARNLHVYRPTRHNEAYPRQVAWCASAEGGGNPDCGGYCQRIVETVNRTVCMNGS